MLTRRELFTALAPESLEPSPHLPTPPRKALRAIQTCQSGHYGPSLEPCHTCGGQPRVNHACGNRHGPQCQHHKTQQGLQHHLDKPLPGPHWLMTCTVPETRRPFIRSQQRPASQALCQASATALKRLAHDERFSGTNLPGCPGVLHTWGRPLHDHPHIHSIVPGGGLAAARAVWLPCRANCFVPVTALSPISRAICHDDMRQAGLLEESAPQVWRIPWNGHSQAKHHGHAACTSLAPYVFTVASSNRRLVSLNDRTVPWTSRKVASPRPRTAQLDVMEFLRRCLQHILPAGFPTVRHCGCLHASCAVPLATIRLMLGHGQPSATPVPPPPPPRVARCPTCGVPMVLIMRRWTSPRALGATSWRSTTRSAGRAQTRRRTTSRR